MRKISVQIIELARPGQDLLITKVSDSNVIELVWRDHQPFNIEEVYGE